MLSLHGLQPSFSSLMGTEWTVRRYEITALHRHAAGCEEQPGETAAPGLYGETQQKEIYPVTCAMEKDGSGFDLTLATFPWRSCQSFRSAGSCGSAARPRRSRRIMGKSFYRVQEFRRVFDLPEEVNPEGLSCSMADDGKLYIQAPVNQRSEDADRMISTDCEDYRDI
ncbi:hypothetical protein ABG768_005150 [Culter alburnus]|uniref:SHSP domain-containing protein n=1 Tax=Culter alburnus TaxID=194366 RepID=A0AAW1ZRL7_CULAL